MQRPRRARSALPSDRASERADYSASTSIPLEA